jgi:hypothetical protein
MILIPKNRKDEFTIKINEFKSIIPVKVLNPDVYILPENLLEDCEILELLPELKNLELINKKDIILIEVII